MKTLDRTILSVLAIGVWMLVIVGSQGSAVADEDFQSKFDAALNSALSKAWDETTKTVVGEIPKFIEQNCYVQNGDDDDNVHVHCGSWHSGTSLHWDVE